MRTSVATALLACLAAQSPAQTAQPLSAIDWLSDSVAALPPAARPERPLEPGVSEDASAAPISVAPLDAEAPDAIGLFAAAERGLPDDLWRNSDIAALLPHLAVGRDAHLAAVQRLLGDMLEARAAAPRDSAGGTQMFLARVDALLAMGRIGSARALLDEAREETPQNFRRRFDIALLTGQENRACERMRALPQITPTYPARIFCLARGGDWMAAALTLDTAKALDVVDAAEVDRLNRFLDDHAAGAGTAPPPVRVSPLDFAIYEAIGEPIATSTLPIAFAHADLRHNTGWKARIEAAERLARAGAIGPDRLWSVYGEREPAASGGLWDRVGALQDLDRAVARGDAEAVAADLPDAWSAMRAAGLAPIFARRYAAALADLRLDGAAGDIALRAQFLTPAGIRDGTPRPHGFLGRLADGDPGADGADGALERAIADGFAARPPDQVARIMAQGRTGEALLIAAEHLDDGAAGNLDAVRDGLASLRAAGQTDRAIEAGLELLIRDRRE